MKKAFLILISFCFTIAGLAQDMKIRKEKKDPVKDPEELVPGRKTEYNAWALSTNFTVPIIRFNPIDGGSAGAPTDRKGNISFFNSIGAGIGIYFGKLTEIADENKEIGSTEMDNVFGVQTGFLFAANASGANNSNIFAWTLGFSLLNFQVGYGYELGTVNANDKRGFLTVAYGIPVSKLIKGGAFVLRKNEIVKKDKTRSRFF